MEEDIQNMVDQLSCFVGHPVSLHIVLYSPPYPFWVCVVSIASPRTPLCLLCTYLGIFRLCVLIFSYRCMAHLQ